MTNKILSPEEKAAALIADADAAGKLKRVVFSKPTDKTVVKATLTPCIIGGSRVWQTETFYADNKARQHNDAPDTLIARLGEILQVWGQVNILLASGSCEYKRNAAGHSVLIGETAARASLADAATVTVRTGNDKEKNRILTGDEPFLKALDVSDEKGRVHDKKQPKFRQINRFLELIRDVEDKLPQQGELHICDLCCGKSYLSFAVYHYFAVMKGRTVRMEGVDLKPDVMDYCNSVAKKVGFTGLTFTCGDVGKYETTGHVHMVLSLHACDIATDLVLERAMHWGADLILSTPCCHHWLNHNLKCDALSFIADYSMLRQKLCDAATDAMRLKLLEANGYEVTALELIDPEETPKNIMLRGIKSKKFDPNGRAAEKARAEYESARAFLLCGLDKKA